MAILHDSLLAAATAARQRVSMRFKVHPSGLQHCCSLLWPRLEVQRRMARRRKLAAALQVGLLSHNWEVWVDPRRAGGCHILRHMHVQLAAATATRQRFSMRFKVHPSGLLQCCNLLWPRLEVQRRMASWPISDGG